MSLISTPMTMQGSPEWVTGGKTPSEYIFSELPQVADIVRSAFHHLATHWYCGSLFWVQAIPAQECHEIIQNRLALLGEESVSVGHRRHRPG
jgi:hypothetical protein